MKNFKGYISSRKLNNDKTVEQSIQNMTIRNCCEKRGYTFLLSATEFGMKNSFLVLNQVLSEIQKYDGIAFYSFLQLPKNKKKALEILKLIVNSNKKILFSLENLLIENFSDINKIYQIISIDNLLKYTPKKI